MNVSYVMIYLTFSLLCFQVGVQTMVEPNAGADALEDRVNAAHPITEHKEEQ